MLRRGAAAAIALIYVDFLDELGSGVGPVSAADIRDDLGLGYGELGLILLVAPLLLSMFIEGPLLLLLSDRWRRDRVAALCVALMGVCMLAAAGAGTAWALAAALGVWGSLSGVGCGLSQGMLMDAYPEARERWMTRWTLMGTLGDAATPALIVGAVALGLGWRGALVGAALLFGIHALVLARVRLPTTVPDCEDGGGEREPEQSLWSRLRAGLGDRELLMWLGACALCCLLDEILVAFGAVFLRDELGAGIEVQGLAFTVAALGGALGLVLADVLLRRVDARRLLLGAALATGLVFGAWLQARSIPASVALLGLLGLVGAPLYPICAARAYAARPGQAGLVAAIDQLFAPVPLLAPLLVGFVADRVGIELALTILVLEPLGVAVVAARAARQSREGMIPRS